MGVICSIVEVVKISNKLVTEFGGKFMIESDLGEGAEFIFTINLSENLEEELVYPLIWMNLTQTIRVTSN